MTHKDLNFLLAYAEVHQLNSQKFTDVVAQASHYLDTTSQYCDISIEEVIDDFLDRYNSMKEYHLDEEAARSMEEGPSFHQACDEWDI